MSIVSRLLAAAARRLASNERRKRALVLLVAVPLALAFGLGALVGSLAQAAGWEFTAIPAIVLTVAAVALFAARALLATAQSIRRRHATSWIPEKLRPLRLEVSNTEPRRVDVIHPAIDLKHFFGGFIAVFNLARELAERGHRVRLITTERADLPADWRQRISGYEGLSDTLERIEVVFAHDRQPITFNPEDTLLATHWTVAHIAHAASAHLRRRRFVYLIQEYEPFIFPMGSAAALARESYDLPHRAIFSTALLRDYFANHRIGVFAVGAEGAADSAVFDNAITPVGTVTFEDLERQASPRLLFYARPEEHAQRNLFEIGAMALDRVLTLGGLAGWELAGIGSVEPRTGPLVLPESGAQVEMIPRTSQAGYAQLLRSCALGLALMYTPHPSLVPIEMASAGMVTMTNTFENKDAAALAAISPNLRAVEPTVTAIATALVDAEAETGDLEARVQGAQVDWPSSWQDALNEDLLREIERWLENP